MTNPTQKLKPKPEEMYSKRFSTDGSPAQTFEEQMKETDRHQVTKPPFPTTNISDRKIGRIDGYGLGIQDCLKVLEEIKEELSG